MPHRILVVDDEPPIRRLLRTGLEHAGYEVLEAADGEEAIRIATETSIDLVITDLVMPEKEGIELNQHFRKSCAPLKIVAISGVSFGQYLHLAHAFGADATLEKPFGMAEMAATIARLLTPGSGREQS